MFEPLVSFTKDVSDLADKPVLDPAVMKAQFDAAPDEVRVYLNKLIDALKLTTAGDSGAKNIGATNITGLTGTDVQSLLESINTTFAKKSQESWSNITLSNGWANLPGFSPAKYRKNQFGNVRGKGVVTGGNTSSGFVVFTFPPGYRPPEDEIFTVGCYINNTTKSFATLRVRASTGDVQVDYVPGNSWLSLSGICFDID
jgi:hypothetical protein